MKKRAIILLLLVCLLSGCAQKAEEEEITLLEPVGVALDSAVATIGDLYELITFDSAVVPAVEELYMTVGGEIDKLYVTIGDWVNAGDVLLELDESDTQEAYDTLLEQIEYAETMNDYDNRLAQLDIELRRNELKTLEAQRGTADEESLNSQIALKQVDIEEAELALSQAKERQALSLSRQYEELEELSAKLGKNKLIAPCDGRITYALSVQEGDWLNAYTTVAYLADESRLSLSGDNISQTQRNSASRIYALIEGQEYAITYQDMEKKDYISLVLAGYTIPSCFSFDAGDAPEGVEAGQYAAICLVTKQKEDVLLIPTNAIMRDAGGKYVYVIDADGERSYRAIKTGTTTAWQTEVTEGLQEGEVVYVKD